MADIDYDKLAEAVRRGQAGNSTPAKPADTGPLKGVIDAFNPLSAATKGVTGAIDTATNAYSKVKGVIDEGMGTWQKLSSSGASFSNDIVGMSAAAAGTRMPLNEFAEVIKENAGKFNGLGGNAAKGAENFAKLSKEMADSGVTDDLRQLGMTSKDINDTLAITLAQQQTINMADAKSRERAIKAATELAFEMDSMAKLTGKSRQEQEEAMKKAQADMQVEAKLRILTAGKSAEETEAIRQGFLKQYNEANLRGQGQMFKEVFATGTVQSEEAANQVAISGREAQMTMAQARATAAGDAKAASEYSKQAQVEAMKNQNDVNKLQLAAYSSNTAAGETMKKSMEANAGMYKAEQAVTLELERAGKLKGLDEQQKAALVHEEALKKIKQEQNNETEEGKKKAGSESTEALVKLGARAADVNSAFMNKIVNPINKDLGPALEKFNKGLGSAQFVDKTGKVTTKVKAAEESMGAGYDKSKAGGQSASGGEGGIAGAAKKQSGGSALENMSQGIGEVFGSAVGLANKAGLPTRDEGTSGKTGQAVEPQDAIVKIAKGEMVLTPEQVANMGKQVAAGAKMPEGGGINIAEIGKTISTTISDAGGAGPKPDLELKAKNEELKKQFEEAAKIINDSGKGHIDAEVRMMESGRMRLREYSDKEHTSSVSMSQSHSEERIAEIIAQAKKIKEEQAKAGAEQTTQKTEQIAKEVDLNTQATEKIKESLPFDEFAGLDEAIAKQKAASEKTADQSDAETKRLASKIAPPTLDQSDAETKRLASKIAPPTVKAPDQSDAETKRLLSKVATPSSDLKLPPFLQQLNAQIKDIKPVELKTPTPTAAKSAKSEVKPPEKKEEAKKTTPKPEEKKPAAAVQEIGLKEVHTSLEHLNKSMAQILTYTKQTADAAQAQVKATKSLSGNKFA